jgi:hypothetical protein
MRFLGRALLYDARDRIYTRLWFLGSAAITFEIGHLLLTLIH